MDNIQRCINRAKSYALYQSVQSDNEVIFKEVLYHLLVLERAKIFSGKN